MSKSPQYSMQRTFIFSDVQWTTAELNLHLYVGLCPGWSGAYIDYIQFLLLIKGECASLQRWRVWRAKVIKCKATNIYVPANEGRWGQSSRKTRSELQGALPLVSLFFYWTGFTVFQFESMVCLWAILLWSAASKWALAKHNKEGTGKSTK